MVRNIKNQKEIVRRIKEDGKICHPLLKYKMTVDNLTVGEFYAERLSEHDANMFCKEYADDKGISQSGVKVDRVMNIMKYTVLPHYGKVN